jgi:hypothetical protein
MPLERKRRLAKARRTRYLKTEKGHKSRSAQNKRCYVRRKAAGKVQAVYARTKVLRPTKINPSELKTSSPRDLQMMPAQQLPILWSPHRSRKQQQWRSPSRFTQRSAVIPVAAR